MDVTEVLLPAPALDSLIQLLKSNGYLVLAPSLNDSAIIYDEIDSAADLPQGWTAVQDNGRYHVQRRDDNAYFGYAVGPHAWKKYLHPAKVKIWDAVRIEGELQISAPNEDMQPMAFLGVRSCELQAIAIQDKVFLQGAHIDNNYQQRRASLLTIAVNCTTPAATCFCTSMGGDPEVTGDSDLTLTEMISEGSHHFLIRAGSDKGRDILRQLPTQPADNSHREQKSAALADARHQLAQNPRAFPPTDLKRLLYRQLSSPLWDDIAERCLSCANCTLACPTCFCTTVEDTTDLSANHAERWQRWDSCFTADFSYVHGGSVRQSTRDRYRQWMTHKLATWHDQFDSPGCVGCGRCIAWCPVGIDITENIRLFTEADNTPKPTAGKITP